MAQLDDQLAALQAVLSQLEVNSKADLANLFAANAWSGPAQLDNPHVRQYIIDVLAEQVPQLAQQSNAAAAAVTAQWYDELAPDQPYIAEVPNLDTLLPTEKVVKSISWAVNTATTVDTALAQLQKSVQRMVYDGSRDTVVWNATKEGVKYVRHANYAGVCNWCLVMATKGAIYKSAAAAVAGHDNCKCFAVPLRKGVHYEPPAEVKAAEKKYVAARKKVLADGKQPSLDNILGEMDKIDAAAVAKAAPPASAYSKLPPTQKKTVQNSYQGKKNKAKAKFGESSPQYTGLKAMGTEGYYEVVYLPEHAAVQTAVKATAKAEDVTKQAQWLAAEAQHNAKVAIDLAAKVEGQAAATATAKPAAYKATQEAESAAVEAAQAVDTGPQLPHPAAVPDTEAPDFKNFTMQGGAGGSHGAVIMTDSVGEKFLVKPQKHYKNLLDQTTAHLQHQTGLPTPTTWTTNQIPGISEASVQEFFPGGNAFGQSIISKGNLKPGDQLELQKNQVYDWLIGNHDTHAQQWVRDTDGKLAGIDKGQAFKWYGKDKLDWDFHPNKSTGEHEPIYNTLWKMALDNQIEMLNPQTGHLHAYIQGVQDIPDVEFKAALRPFAEAAAKDGKLLNATDGYGLLPKYPIAPNDVEAFLDLAVARKNNLQNDFDNLYAKYVAKKTGTSPSAPPPQVVPQPGLKVDIDLAEKSKTDWVVSNIIDAHKLAKHGDLADAQMSLDKASLINGMTTEEWVASPMSQGLIGKAPVSPAAKALVEYQKATYTDILNLFDQGAVHPGTLQQPGHVAGTAAKKADDAFKMTPTDFAAKFPEKVQGFTNPQPVSAVQPSDYHKLDAATKKTVQNSYSGKKNKAKVKFGQNSPEYQELKAMGPDGYYAKVYSVNKPAAQAVAPKVEPLADWEEELIAAAKTGAPAPDLSKPKPIDPETDAVVQVTVGELKQQYDALNKDALYKIGNQFSGKKNKAKKATDPEGKHLNYLYSTWSKKDFWASQELKPGGSIPHPYAENVDAKQLADLQVKEYTQAKKLQDEWVSTHPGQPANDSPYLGAEHILKWSNSAEYKQWLIDHGQTTLLGSPMGGYPKVPGVKVTTAAPPKNPPNDLAKLAKIQDWQAQYLTAKPGGTGFNPVKSFNPEGSLKTNMEGFASEIGVGYLTDEQLTQVLVKLPASQKVKYLKQYQDAKGVDAANAVGLKVNPPTNPSVVSPPTSMGSKPSGTGSAYKNSWKQNVQIKPGTTHTPVRVNPLTSVKDLNGTTGKVVKDASAPLGSADNPHVFSYQDHNDYKTFGSLHTDQDESAWVQAHLKPVKSYTGASYGNYNSELRDELAKLIDDWIDADTGQVKIDPATGKPKPKPKPSAKVQNIDAAFTDPTTTPLEEWTVLTRGTSRREFNDNDVEGLAPWISGGKAGTTAELKALEGHTYIQRGIGSTSISDVPAFSYKHVRVIYRMPPGSKVVYVDGTPNSGWGGAISNNAGEREVLLPRDSRYKVLEVRDSTHHSFGIDVVVELVEQELFK